ncbi:MAG: hypothetical protein PF569_00090 [Candidatus Woesearchaeota archaeon]|jgi:hypothetical protein|nr:hypothetical protein [Candidatus Woesearchaeota archaeon]
MDLVKYNNLKNKFEELIFDTKIITINFNNIESVQIYLRLVDSFLLNSINFKDTDIDVVDLFKRNLGFYSKPQPIKDISKELNKQKTRIEVLFLRAVNKLSHPFKQAELISLLIDNEIALDWLKVTEIVSKNRIIKDKYRTYIVTKLKENN